MLGSTPTGATSRPRWGRRAAAKAASLERSRSRVRIPSSPPERIRKACNIASLFYFIQERLYTSSRQVRTEQSPHFRCDSMWEELVWMPSLKLTGNSFFTRQAKTHVVVVQPNRETLCRHTVPHHSPCVIDLAMEVKRRCRYARRYLCCHR